MDNKRLSIKKRIVYTVEGIADRIFTPRYNPFYYLGTICAFLLVLIAISGLYLFFFYRTSSPYETMQSITVNQWYLGGILRSIHRYASDGLILFLVLHLLREFLLGRYRHWRWVSWVSGNALLLTSILVGIIGYFLVWDERAQLIAVRTAQLLDDIPVFIEPPPRTFLSIATMSKMLFFVLLLAHIMISMIGMGILTAIHVSRNARPAVKPPKAIAVAVLVILVLISLIIPATNASTVSMTKVPADAPFDWFYLFIYPLASILPKGAFWATAVGGTIILFIAPWIGRPKRQPTAQIASEKCVGCEQCHKDCPYEAIRMVPRRDGRPYLFQAEVMPGRCASCGTCVGSCGSNAPNLPNRTMEQIEEEITKLLYLSKKEDGRTSIVGLVCEKSVNQDAFIDIKNNGIKGMPNVYIVKFPCAGMINHSVIEHAIESGADGVFVAGCQTGECSFREGSKWAQARLKGERAPVLVLRGDVSYSKIRTYWLSPLQTGQLINEIGIFEKELKNGSDGTAYEIKDLNMPKEMILKKAVRVPAIALLMIPALIILFLSVKPIYPFYNKDMALIKFTFKYSSKHTEEQRELTKADTENKLKHMRKTNSAFEKIRKEGGRGRLPVYVEVELDSKNVLSKTYYPTGLKNDGPTFAYEELPVAPGMHNIKVGMRDSKDEDKFDYVYQDKIELKPGKITVIDFDEEKGEFCNKIALLEEQ
jgi:quinol-cytochrome oxidoreductase complex cytochrome b subunit/coenzyme F420-reducing hydrogenase delta subunit